MIKKKVGLSRKKLLSRKKENIGNVSSLKEKSSPYFIEENTIDNNTARINPHFKLEFFLVKLVLRHIRVDAT